MTTSATETRSINAAAAATAWLNAAIAVGQDEGRPALYRTLSVEFFPTGVQFVGCDGTMLFRTWAPYTDTDDVAPPLWEEAPDETVVVSDVDKFALAFMKTVLSAVGDIPFPLSIAVEAAEADEQAPLGDDLQAQVLTLQALGQRLTCRLYEGAYPNWRALQFGMDARERVEGMTLATRLFAAVGKLKGVVGIDCTFRGESQAIEFVGGSASTASVSGLLMPMRRPEKGSTSADAADQLEHE